MAERRISNSVLVAAIVLTIPLSVGLAAIVTGLGGAFYPYACYGIDNFAHYHGDDLNERFFRDDNFDAEMEAMRQAQTALAVRPPDGLHKSIKDYNELMSKEKRKYYNHRSPNYGDLSLEDRIIVDKVRNLATLYSDQGYWHGVRIFVLIVVAYIPIGRAFSSIAAFLCDRIDSLFGMDRPTWGGWSPNRHLWFGVFWPIALIPTFAVAAIAIAYGFMFTSLFDPKPKPDRSESLANGVPPTKKRIPEL